MERTFSPALRLSSLLDKAKICISRIHRLLPSASALVSGYGFSSGCSCGQHLPLGEEMKSWGQLPHAFLTVIFFPSTSGRFVCLTKLSTSHAALASSGLCCAYSGLLLSQGSRYACFTQEQNLICLFPGETKDGQVRRLGKGIL